MGALRKKEGGFSCYVLLLLISPERVGLRRIYGGTDCECSYEFI